MRRLLVLVCLWLWGTTAYADTIAMLPLDGEKRLEILGQPVAAEIARALKAAGLEVVVVGAKMGVPDGANLIVDGTIKATKNKQIEVSIRIRDPRDGSTLDTLPASTTKLDDLDKAAAALSARLVPAVQTQLDVLAKKKAAAAAAVHDKPVNDTKPALPVRPPAPVGPALATMATGLAPLSAELDREAKEWAKTQPYQANVSFEVLAYSAKDLAKAGKAPLARARVQVKISDATGTKFDRVIRTDTVVGDPGIAADKLAARTAREVLAILRPHLKRALGR